MRGTRVKILGVGADRITREEALDEVGLFLRSSAGHHVVTLNSEMAVRATRDEELRAIVNGADLVTADGMGILRAASYLGKRRGNFLGDLLRLGAATASAILAPGRIKDVLPEKISGVDLMRDICAHEIMAGRRVYLLGAREGIAARAASALQASCPHIEIAGAEAGFFGPAVFGEDAAIVERINAARADVLFVALGVPKQEKWIRAHLAEMPNVRLAMGVGGSFDVLAGRVQRAPRFMQTHGLEWLWRFGREPRRARRIYDATFRFLWLVYRDKRGSGPAH